MADHTIDWIRYKPWNINSSNDNWILTFDGMVMPSPMSGIVHAGMFEAQRFHDNVINIAGVIQGTAVEYGIDSNGTSTDINLTFDGFITGPTGIRSGGDGVKITSYGEIYGASAGIMLDGDQARLNNYGLVSGGTSIVVSGEGAHISNREKGEIGGITGIEIDGGHKALVFNSGLIAGGYWAVLAADDEANGILGSVNLINRGTIEGNVYLGAGNSRFDARGGVLLGKIFGGDGHDLLITDKADYVLTEKPGGGKDTVRSTVSYVLSDNVETLALMGTGDIDGSGNAGINWIIGNAGTNRLFGAAGGDYLDGRGGSDLLIGGNGRDQFHFGNGSGADTIRDFSDGIDIIDLQGHGSLASFADLTGKISVAGSDLLIDLGGGDTITLKNMTDPTILTADDFRF